jgi:hypothetical protein
MSKLEKPNIICSYMVSKPSIDKRLFFFLSFIMSNSTTSSGETNSALVPPASNVVFTILNMNHTLQIKLSNANFPSWRTQIMAFVKAQDSYGFLDGSTQPPA